ncbi:hypothetical protein HID58_054750 [Brassica napus]|uniref:BnaC03g48710D protein n=5 Tax=Brassica TaxID=3705 RepID=A0A078HFE8_BRANA|nr:hypothetical protein HID58_054750 [Brassica napus]CAF1706750.1 unnamed protein product [Brassica napus]CDY36512.1 BnaC03g48710D [Brassica napus]VDC94890.1 unnamed protein product [Brassica oleracea]
MKAKEMKKERALSRLVKSPVRFLIMARDAYIRSMTSCSVGFITGGGSGGFGLSAGNFQICEAPSTTLPRSFILNTSTTTGTRERCRFVTRGGGVGENRAAMRRPLDLRRNYSCMVMGRIDEEKACDEFEEEGTEISRPSGEQSWKMRGREEKRRKLHEALLQTLYPPSSPSSSPSPVLGFDDEPFDVTLINPEDYLNIDSSNHGDDHENGDEPETKPSRAQRKRIRKKMLKEEAARRRKVIGPLLPTEMIETREDSSGGEEASCIQPARLNASEKEEKVSFEGNDKTKKVKQRREAKKLAKESSNPTHIQDPTSETS